MTPVNTRIQYWQNIFLDTGIIINLLLHKKSPNSPEAAFVYSLISYLAKNKTTDGKTRNFYISSITLCEILSAENNSEKIHKILSIIDSENVEFVSFDDVVALQLNSVIHPYLSKEYLHRFAREVGFLENELMMAREWIIKDQMIIMSGANRGVDVILTMDKKAFHSFCVQIQAPCALCYKELFDYNDTYFFLYKKEKVSAFTSKVKNHFKVGKTKNSKKSTPQKTINNLRKIP